MSSISGKEEMHVEAMRSACGESMEEVKMLRMPQI